MTQKAEGKFWAFGLDKTWQWIQLKTNLNIIQSVKTYYYIIVVPDYYIILQLSPEGSCLLCIKQKHASTFTRIMADICGFAIYFYLNCLSFGRLGLDFRMEGTWWDHEKPHFIICPQEISWSRWNLTSRKIIIIVSLASI